MAGRQRLDMNRRFGSSGVKKRKCRAERVLRMIYKIVICFIAGMGAGLGTGFAGMSAAAVIAPMLIAFLGMPAYDAVGIALVSDVLASAVSAYTYGKNKNLDIKNGLVMMVTVLSVTVLGSYVSSLMGNSTMGSFSTVMTLLLGIKFLVRPITAAKESMAEADSKKRIMQSIVCEILKRKIPQRGIFLSKKPLFIRLEMT